MHLEETVAGDVGSLDEYALDQIRRVFETQDSLVTEVGFPDLIDPQELRVYFADGIGDADEARLDIRWFRSGYYNVHHTDSAGQDFRWDYHPKDGVSDRHFHPPNSEGGELEKSCITVEEPALVARAVHKLWRRAYDTETLSGLNMATNPP